MRVNRARRLDHGGGLRGGALAGRLGLDDCVALLLETTARCEPLASPPGRVLRFFDGLVRFSVGFLIGVIFRAGCFCNGIRAGPYKAT